MALVGIALVLFFIRFQTHDTELFQLLILFITTLIFDLLQYVAGGLIWYLFFLKIENDVILHKKTNDEDIKAPKWMPGIIHVLYWCKIITNIISYIILYRILFHS